MKMPDLYAVKAWAQEAVHGGKLNPPPWEWYQYMKLIEAIDALTGGMKIPVNAISIVTANSQQSVPHQGNDHRHMVVVHRQGNAQSHLDKQREE